MPQTFALAQFTGCLLGLATGDALGAPFEGGPLARLLWRLIGRTRDGCMRWSDDTQMALDLAQSLLAQGGFQADDVAQRFAKSYKWSRGYGPGAAKVLKRIRAGQPWQSAATAVYPQGSFGNGAAMRAAVLALFFGRDQNALVAAAQAQSVITHAHPLGVQGAVMIALAAQALLLGCSNTQTLASVQQVCQLPEFAQRLQTIVSWLTKDQPVTAREVARQLGNGMTAPTSCTTALYLALRFRNQTFTTLMQFIIAVGGDVDTIAAMAGALWGIANGAAGLPDIALEAKPLILQTAQQLFARHAADNAS